MVLLGYRITRCRSVLVAWSGSSFCRLNILFCWWVISRVFDPSSGRVHYLHVSELLNEWFSRFFAHDSRSVRNVVALQRLLVKILLLFLKLIEMPEWVGWKVDKRAFFIHFSLLVSIVCHARGIGLLLLITIVLALEWLVLPSLVHIRFSLWFTHCVVLALFVVGMDARLVYCFLLIIILQREFALPAILVVWLVAI